MITATFMPASLADAEVDGARSHRSRQMTSPEHRLNQATTSPARQR